MNIDVSSEQVAQLAEALREAERTGAPIAPLTEASPAMTVEVAYAIQRANLDARLARGERLVGRKIGLTSLAIQRQLGVDQPDFGAITDAMEIADGDECAVETLIAPRVEAEFAFEIGTDLSAEPSLAEVEAALSSVAVAMEIIDSRIVDWRIALADTVADNASMARVVWGKFVPATPELLAALPELVISLHRDGVTVSEGPGSAVLGHPAKSVHWLAHALGAQGDTLRAGDRVLAGAVSAAVPLTAGSSWQIETAGLPAATLRTPVSTLQEEQS